MLLSGAGMAACKDPIDATLLHGLGADGEEKTKDRFDDELCFSLKILLHYSRDSDIQNLKTIESIRGKEDLCQRS